VGRSPLVIVGSVALGVAIFVAALANSMTKPVGRDEQMYCTAGVLMSQGKLVYRDFSYPAQLPYHPLLYAWLFRVSGTKHYLLAGRVVSAVCDTCVGMLIFWMFVRAFGRDVAAGGMFGLGGVLLYLFNPLVDYANGYAWNHDVVNLCVMAAYTLFAGLCGKGKGAYLRAGAVGAILAFAACMRITTVLVEAVFFGFLVFQQDKSRSWRAKAAASFLCGSAAVVLWPAWVIASAPQAFALNLMKIPRLYGRWLAELGMVHNKLALTVGSVVQPGYLCLIVLMAYLGIVFLRRGGRADEQERRMFWLAVSISAAFFVIAYIPPTMWRQYLGVPVAFGVVSLAHPLAALWRSRAARDGNRRFKAAAGIVVCSAVVAVVFYPVVLLRMGSVLSPEQWVPLQLHRVAKQIGERVQGAGRVLTLWPVLALEGGCEIYPELSAGAIVYRVGDLLTEAERRVTHTVGPESLKELLEKEPPCAVVVGAEARYFAFLEEPLVAAAGPEWVQQSFAMGLKGYFRPAEEGR